jgi:hypothetical protein
MVWLFACDIVINNSAFCTRGLAISENVLPAGVNGKE